MSVPKNGKTKEKKPVEPKSPTAPQLFARYMRTVERANKLSRKLEVEIVEAERLADELWERFKVHVGNTPPATKTQPVTAEVGDGGDADAATPPAVPMTAPAPHLAARESADVAKIRREAGLTEAEQADTEALAADAGQQMAKLQAAMGGVPAVVPSPGAIEGAPRAPDPGPDNSEGGPVVQKPVEEA